MKTNKCETESRLNARYDLEQKLLVSQSLDPLACYPQSIVVTINGFYAELASKAAKANKKSLNAFCERAIINAIAEWYAGERGKK